MRKYAWGISLALIAGCGWTRSFERVFVFGDSLSDTGNVFALSGGTQPPAPYFNGRFSNGPVWVEHLAATWNTQVPPFSLGGTNYAFGGAASGNGFSPKGVPNVGTQIDLFQASGRHLGSRDLVILLVGANDFFDGETNPFAVGNRITAQWNRLSSIGARNLVVCNLPSLGQIPANYGTANQLFANLVSGTLNVQLQVSAIVFQLTHWSTRVYFMDLQGLLKEVQNEPARFGFSNVYEAYLTTGSKSNPDSYLFWDSVHPTRAAHTIIARRANRLFQ